MLPKYVLCMQVSRTQHQEPLLIGKHYSSYPAFLDFDSTPSWNMKGRELAYFFPLHLASRACAGYTFHTSSWLIGLLSGHPNPHRLECPWRPWSPNLCLLPNSAGPPNLPLPHTRVGRPTPVTLTPIILRLGLVQPSRLHGQAHFQSACARGLRARTAPSP